MHAARVTLTGRVNMEASEVDDGEFLIRRSDSPLKLSKDGMTISSATVASDV